jgi:hypothetical protein
VHCGDAAVRSPPTNKKPPRVTSGETASRFVRRGMRVKAVGLAVGGSPTDDARSSGRRRRNGPIPAAHRQEKDHDALTYVSLARRSSRSGSVLRGDQNDLVARSISSSNPRSSALRSARDEERPSTLRTGGRDTWHTPRQPGGLPFGSPPRRVAISRCPARLARPLPEFYQLQSEKTRDKDLKKHGDFDGQAQRPQFVGCRFQVTFAMITMAGVRPTRST